MTTAKEKDIIGETQHAYAHAGPQDVVTALAAVMGELGGIEKLTSAERQRRGLGGGDGGQGVTYAYRGIDQIAAACQPLFAKYGVVVIPSRTEMEIKDITVNQKPWTDTIIHVEWMVYGPNSTSIAGASEGIGRDNSDKGANKAMTAAYKNLLLKMLSIGDPDDDTDHTRQEAEYRHEEPPAPQYPKAAVKLYERMRTEAPGTLAAAELKRLAAENHTTLTVPAIAEDDNWAAVITGVLDDAAFKLPAEEQKDA